MNMVNCRPISGRHGSVAEHLYKAGARPQSRPKLDSMKDAAKKGLKYAVGGAVFYFAVSLALGGRDRVRHDLEVLKVSSDISCDSFSTTSCLAVSRLIRRAGLTECLASSNCCLTKTILFSVGQAEGK